MFFATFSVTTFQMLQAAQHRRFHCFVFTLAQLWLMLFHSTSQSSLEIDLGFLRLIQSPNQWVEALAVNLSLDFAQSMG